jgi:hypothetical protein
VLDVPFGVTLTSRAVAILTAPVRAVLAGVDVRPGGAPVVAILTAPVRAVLGGRQEAGDRPGGVAILTAPVRAVLAGNDFSERYGELELRSSPPP